MEEKKSEKKGVVMRKKRKKNTHTFHSRVDLDGNSFPVVLPFSLAAVLGLDFARDEQVVHTLDLGRLGSRE